MPQPRERVNSFLERARACRVAAGMTSNAEARATYLDLADSWQTLARQVGRAWKLATGRPTRLRWRRSPSHGRGTFHESTLPDMSAGEQFWMRSQQCRIPDCDGGIRQELATVTKSPAY